MTFEGFFFFSSSFFYLLLVLAVQGLGCCVGFALVAVSRSSQLWCEGFSLPPAPGAWASGVLTHGLNSCGSWALERRLSGSPGAELLRGAHVRAHVPVHVHAQSCRLFTTPWAVVRQALLSLAISEQE